MRRICNEASSACKGRYRPPMTSSLADYHAQFDVSYTQLKSPCRRWRSEQLARCFNSTDFLCFRSPHEWWPLHPRKSHCAWPTFLVIQASFNIPKQFIPHHGSQASEPWCHIRPFHIGIRWRPAHCRGRNGGDGPFSCGAFSYCNANYIRYKNDACPVCEL